MALTRNSVVVFNLRKTFFPSPSSIFICRHVWKGGDVVTEDNKSKGETLTGGDGRYSEIMGEKRKKETKEKATETAQEAWRAIEEAAGEMKQRVVANMDSSKETDIRDEMALHKQEEEEEQEEPPW
ncbi:PREDICTED: uncharacterized protein LOC109165781 [Ipomoea nil]|uniref:uncharacterized protein LOC109165781 n=1 Tax=Ipomoea nil TaxID=35883 RepID=UPI0009016F96|nr:PREDICTED: uncharacterized protein LOC109165781 [Ipomoea nil]